MSLLSVIQLHNFMELESFPEIYINFSTRSIYELASHRTFLAHLLQNNITVFMCTLRG